MEPKKPSQDRDAVAQLELLHLDRQFRVMKNDEDACPAPITRTLTQQKNFILGLGKEKEELLTSLMVFDKNFVKDQHDKTSREVTKLLLEHKNLEDRAAAIKEDVKDLDVQIQVSLGKVEQKIRTRGGAGMIAEAMKIEQRYDENLENRMHTEACRCNEHMMRNAVYGRQVEDLLKERERFLKHFGTLSKDLVTGKKIITDLVEQSSYAFEQRREAETKLTALRTKEKQDFLVKCSEARFFERSTLHRAKLNEFLAKKSQRRIVASIEEEKTAKKEGAVRDMTDFLEKYTGIVHEIQERFGEDDMDRLVMQFMKLEEDNYNMCKFINDLNEKLDQMRGEICGLQHAISEQRGLNKLEKEQQSMIISDLEKELEVQGKMVLVCRGKLDSALGLVDSLLQRISLLFFLAHCDGEDIYKMLGENRKVRVDNVLMYLKNLERRFKELKIFFHQSFKPRISTELKIHVSKTDMPDGPCPLCAEARDLSQVDDSEAVPLSIDTCREQLHEELRKGFRTDFLHSAANCHLPKSRRIMREKKGF